MKKLPKVHHQSRTSHSLKVRWQRTIYKEVQLFNGCYSRIVNKNPSGWNEEKIMEEATKLYIEQTGHREFKYAECYEILQELPKFDPMKSSVDNISGPRTNCDGKLMGEGMERPIGSKKAKEMIEREYEESSLVDSFATFQSSMVDVNKRFVDVMERKQRHDTWIKQTQCYQAMGKTDIAMEFMKKIEMDELNAHKVSTPHMEIGSQVLRDVQVPVSANRDSHDDESEPFSDVDADGTE
mmetsp:Transcript_15219/g.28636  ORF Transcript_15219/g.28636 Transcript_15219/m.28636 type:complete len:239 (-) Transcript_15219:50-766(-)